jgi:hypothetical protein
VTLTKNPVFVESGRRGARQRWGEPRVLRLDELTAEQRHLVLALVEAAKKGAPAATAEKAGDDAA